MTDGGLTGLRVLLVEDEVLVAMLFEEMLKDLGCTVIGPATRLDEAQRLVDREQIDAAVLDINLAGTKVFPLADRLASAAVPFVFASGYGETGIDENHKTRPVVQKPFQLAALERALSQQMAK